MIGCNETVTLVRHIRGTDGDTYQCITITGASWFAKTVVANTAKGFTSGNVLKSRIPAKLLAETPRIGDYLVRGAVKVVNKQADLKGTEHFQITAVGDNRRGKLSHWVVSGA